MSTLSFRKKFALGISMVSTISFAGSGGCGTSVGNPAQPEGSASLAIVGTRPGELATLASATAAAVNLQVWNRDGSAGGVLSVSDARVVLKEIKFELEGRSRSTEDSSSEFAGPFVVDLLANATRPSLSSISLASGTYKQIKLKLHKITGSERDSSGAVIVGADDALYNNSIVLSGTYSGPTSNAGSVTAIPFLLAFDLSEEINLTGTGKAAAGFSLVQGLENSILIAFRMVRWFEFNNLESNSDGREFSELVVSNDGNGGSIILFNADSQGNNRQIRQVIKENIKRSADYGKDLNGDGKLDSSEDDDPSDSEGEDD